MVPTNWQVFLLYYVHTCVYEWGRWMRDRLANLSWSFERWRSNIQPSSSDTTRAKRPWPTWSHSYPSVPRLCPGSEGVNNNRPKDKRLQKSLIETWVNPIFQLSVQRKRYKWPIVWFVDCVNLTGSMYLIKNYNYVDRYVIVFHTGNDIDSYFRPFANWVWNMPIQTVLVTAISTWTVPSHRTNTWYPCLNSFFK